MKVSGERAFGGFLSGADVMGERVVQELRRKKTKRIRAISKPRPRRAAGF
jgi:hypothetical protein